MKKSFSFNSTNLLVGIRFIARFMVVAIFGMFITLYITEPASRRNLNPFVLDNYESMLVISFYVVLAGLLLAWKAEKTGSILAIIGLIAFSLFYYALKSSFLWNIWLMAIPAVLFLICWWVINYYGDYDAYNS